MSIKGTFVVAAAIVLSSTVMAAAQTPYYHGGSDFRSIGDPPSVSDFPAAAGGGSVGYNENLKRDDW